MGFRGAFARFFAESGFFLAAGLAFFFLVTVIPLLLLGASTLGFVLSSEEASREVVAQVTRNFPVYRREITAAILRIVETRAVEDVPVRRIGTPEEFANVVVFLASERASYVTGLAVQVDGGLVRGLL